MGNIYYNCFIWTLLYWEVCFRMVKIKNSQAEVSTSFVIKLVILVASFVFIIMAYFVFFGDYQNRLDKGACQESVIYRATFKAGPLESSEVIPLQCKTEKICLTGSKDKCESVFEERSKENPISVHTLSSDEDEAREEVLDAISNALYDCHWMLGEGKVNFLPTKNWYHNYCIICSRFVLDDEAKKLFPEGIKLVDLYEHMDKMPLKEGGDYLEFVYGVENVGIIKRDLAVARENARKGEYSEQGITAEDLEIDNWVLDVNEEKGNAIFVKVITDETISKKIFSGVIFAGSTAVGTYFGFPFFGAKAGIALGGIAYFIAFPDENIEYFGPVLIRYNADDFREQECQSFENLP